MLQTVAVPRSQYAGCLCRVIQVKTLRTLTALQRNVSTMIVSELSTQVNDLLRPMGITRNLSAYSILCQCLELVCEQEDRLQAVEKDIYTPIADRRRCEPKAIQSAVRRAAKGAWLTNPEYVQQLAGYPLTGCPSAVQFIEMLYNALVRAV